MPRIVTIPATACLRRARGVFLLARTVLVACWLAWWVSHPASALGALQFDVFLGYDGTIREAAWFPVVVEVHNDGPSFNAVFELTGGNIRGDQVCRVPLELPTNTRKRFVVPVFASGASSFQWNARLVDERGKVYAERPGLQPRTLAWEGILLGALPRAFAGVPVLPDLRQNRPELKPLVARLQVEQVPDNPIALEGLDALYLNSEKALNLKVTQVAALLAWVYEGGRLIVSVEQIADVNSTPWLQQLLPCDVTDMANVAVDEDLQQWLRQDSQSDTGTFGTRAGGTAGRRQAPIVNPVNPLAPDPNFIDAQMPVATTRLRDGQVVVAAKNVPLIIEAHRGRGEITVLTFSPEREPFRSWKNRSWFWLKLMHIPAQWYGPNEFVAWGGQSLDGVFGALIDSRQVRKLPVEWLLLLLVVYLIVIGPFDQYWLKKINRQMLTWITFPTYVVLFSLLIYFIGYKLRAGETEWNELQVVDVLPHGQKAALRGRTYASVYSSANAKYQLAFTPPSPEAAEQSFACLRSEMLAGYSGVQDASRANVEHYGNVFRAEIFVPVWTSLLYVNDWMEPGSLPLSASWAKHEGRPQIVIENLLDRPLTEARVVFKGTVYEVGTLAARQKKTVTLEPSTGVPLQSFIVQHGNQFQEAVQARRSPLASPGSGHLENLPVTATVASFIGYIPKPEHQRSFVSPPGMDLTPVADRGDAIVLAWDANQSYAKAINQFKPPRLQRNTLLRLVVRDQEQPNP